MTAAGRTRLMALRSSAGFGPPPKEARDSSLMMALAARYRRASAGARFSSRPWQKLPTAVRAAPAHAIGTIRTERAFVTADSGLVAVLGEGHFATLAF